ncbi:MAG: hypothetical protein AAGA99_12465 [Actinomycetota bacterium]
MSDHLPLGEASEPDEEERRRPFVVVLAALAALVPVAVVLILTGTQSSFVGRDSIGTVRAAAATVDIAAGRVSSDQSFENLVPGETIHFGLEVRNDGDLPLRYTLAVVSGDGALAESLQASLRLTNAGCSAATYATGAVIDAPDRLGDGEPLRIFGDPTTGPQPGDRLLRVGRSETLCFEVSVPIDAGNSLQGRRSVQTYVFDAEQATS